MPAPDDHRTRWTWSSESDQMTRDRRDAAKREVQNQDAAWLWGAAVVLPILVVLL
ncbi:hypothetical protein ACVU7I_03720 [Patulibacter sp. S7RM1-6]